MRPVEQFDLIAPVPNLLRYDSRDSVPEVATEQRFAIVRVIRGGSEVTNSPQTFLNGVNSRRDSGVASTRAEKSQRLWQTAGFFRFTSLGLGIPFNRTETDQVSVSRTEFFAKVDCKGYGGCVTTAS